MQPRPAETSAQTARVQLSGHLPGLDGVRGLAIVMVLATHFVGGATAHTLLQRLVVKAAGYGLLGVDLFFVLSGFLITGLLVRAKGRPNYFRNFYARRTLRIFPLYYGVLAGLFLVLPRLTTVTPMLAEAAKHQAWLWTYTSNFYLAHVSDWNTLTYVNHFWSLAVEEHFYLLWPLVVFSFSRPTLERICIGVILVGLAMRIGLAWSGMSELSISVLTPCRVDSLCAGGLLAIVAHRDEGRDAGRLVERALPAALLFGGLIVAVSAWCALTDLGVTTLHQVRDSLYALFFGAVVLLSLRPGHSFFSRAFQNRTLRFLGKYSYGLYVYHAILLWYFTDTHVEARFDALLGNHWLTMIAVAVVGTAISVAVAMLSFHLFEKHLLSLKRFFETDMTEARARRPMAAR
ncbi:MAG: acyltransferase [Vicinamibacterales bacterium]